MPEVEDVLVPDLDEVVPGLAAGVAGNTVQRNLQENTLSLTVTFLAQYLQQLEREPSVLPALEPEAPRLVGGFPGQDDVDEALGALPEQLGAGVDDVVYWDLHFLSSPGLTQHSTQ